MPPDSGNAAVNWSSFLDQVIQGGIDFARVKHLGVPTPDHRVPDQADLYYGNAGDAQAVEPMPAWFWPAVVVGVAIVGALALLRMK